MVKPEQIVALCVRLFAIVLGFNALRSVASMLITHSENSGIDKYQIAIFSFLVTMLFIVVMLWIFPNIIAKKIIPVNKRGQIYFLSIDAWSSGPLLMS